MCPLQQRSDNLIRHLGTHKADWFATAPTQRLRFIANHKIPLMIQKPYGTNNTDVDWAYCLGCNKGQCKGITGHFPAQWVTEHVNECECVEKFSRFEHLYLAKDTEEILPLGKKPVEKLENNIIYKNVETCKHCDDTDDAFTETAKELQETNNIIGKYEDWKFDYVNAYEKSKYDTEDYGLVDDPKKLKIMIKNIMLLFGHVLDNAPHKEENDDN